MLSLLCSWNYLKWGDLTPGIKAGVHATSLLGAIVSWETRLSAWKQWQQLGPDFGSLCKGNHWRWGSSMLHEFPFSVLGFIVWYLFCCLGNLRSVSSSGFFFFLNRADRKDIWSLHQIFIPSKEKLIKVFSVKKDDQRSSVLYHLRCQFHCMLMKGGSWMTQFPKSDLSSSIQPPLLLKSCQVHQSIWLCHEVTEQECSLKDCLHWVFKKIVLFFV